VGRPLPEDVEVDHPLVEDSERFLAALVNFIGAWPNPKGSCVPSIEVLIPGGDRLPLL